MICVYTQLIIVRLKFFPMYWNTCTVWVFSASPSGILAYISLNWILILPKKHSLSIIFCLLLHIFCIQPFPAEHNFFFPCLKQSTRFGGLSHASQYSLFISNISSANVFSYLSKLQRINLERKVLVTLKQAIPENLLRDKYEVQHLYVFYLQPDCKY